MVQQSGLEQDQEQEGEKAAEEDVSAGLQHGGLFRTEPDGHVAGSAVVPRVVGDQGQGAVADADLVDPVQLLRIVADAELRGRSENRFPHLHAGVVGPFRTVDDGALLDGEPALVVLHGGMRLDGAGGHVHYQFHPVAGFPLPGDAEVTFLQCGLHFRTVHQDLVAGLQAVSIGIEVGRKDFVPHPAGDAQPEREAFGGRHHPSRDSPYPWSGPRRRSSACRTSGWPCRG